MSRLELPFKERFPVKKTLRTPGIVLGLMCLSVVPEILNGQPALSPAEQEVWQMELKLVEFSNAGNIDGFLGLFHGDHGGWSRNDPKPGTKRAPSKGAFRPSPRW